MSKLTAHSSAVTCIVLNDTDGYFLTGSSEGDIKVSTCPINSPRAGRQIEKPFVKNEIVLKPRRQVTSYSELDRPAFVAEIVVVSR